MLLALNLANQGYTQPAILYRTPFQYLNNCIQDV